MKRDFEQEIIQCLLDDIYGLTVFSIAEKIGASRNTVYKYLAKLEGENLVFNREVGTYKLYFSREARLISRDIVLSYYKGLLSALNDEIQLNPERFKNIGKRVANYLDIPFDAEDLDKLLKADKNFNLNDLKMLSSLQPYFTLLHDKLTLKRIRRDKVTKKFIFHFVDSDLLEDELPYIYHFYILTGIVEAKIAKFLNIKVECDVEDYMTSKENKENYIEISLKLT